MDIEPKTKLDFWELTSDQKAFVHKFYPEYAEKNPIAVLNWLHNKALAYQEAKLDKPQGFLQKLEEVEHDEHLTDEEVLDEDHEDDIFDSFTDKFSKQEDAQFLKVNKFKHLAPADED